MSFRDIYWIHCIKCSEGSSLVHPSWQSSGIACTTHGVILGGRVGGSRCAACCWWFRSKRSCCAADPRWARGDPAAGSRGRARRRGRAVGLRSSEKERRKSCRGMQCLGVETDAMHPDCWSYLEYVAHACLGYWCAPKNLPFLSLDLTSQISFCAKNAALGVNLQALNLS